jgi:hypothetical protein
LHPEKKCGFYSLLLIDKRSVNMFDTSSVESVDRIEINSSQFHVEHKLSHLHAPAPRVTGKVSGLRNFVGGGCPRVLSSKRRLNKKCR